MAWLFQDRDDAGRQLAAALLPVYGNRADVRVLALPRGGVPVARQVALALAAPLDVLIVRKLGVPGHPEFAMGAIAAGDIMVLDHALIESLPVSAADLEDVVATERRELGRREERYRRGRPRVDIAGRAIILVDDGLATGYTMRAAIAAAKNEGPASIAVAVPVAHGRVCQSLRREVDDVICLATPEPFHAVGAWYASFTQTSDDEVRELLRDPSAG